MLNVGSLRLGLKLSIMQDQPFHHTLDHFVSPGLAFLEQGREAPVKVWGRGHDGAYRQLSLMSYNPFGGRCPSCLQPYNGSLTPDLWKIKFLLVAVFAPSRTTTDASRSP